MGIPPPTIRRWRNDIDRFGITPEVSAELAVVTGDFLDDAIRLRGILLERLERLVEQGKVTPREVIQGIHILSDKIRAYEIVKEKTRVEHTFKLPSADELRELFQGMLSGVVGEAVLRAAEVEAIEEPLAITTYSEILPDEED